MSTFVPMVVEQFQNLGYAAITADSKDGPVVLFENDTILGFAFCFPDTRALIERWRPWSRAVLEEHQLVLRRAERKAWNSYLVFLSEAPGDYGENIMLASIEEDLVGTRKIAKSGIEDIEDLRMALLPLLAIQHAPQLRPVDMAAEIRLRTSELPDELVEAFLSEAPDSSLRQLLEISE